MITKRPALCRHAAVGAPAENPDKLSPGGMTILAAVVGGGGYVAYRLLGEPPTEKAPNSMSVPVSMSWTR